MIVEIIGFLSVILIGYGSYLIYEPLGFLIPGVVILFLCFLVIRKRELQKILEIKRTKEKEKTN